MYYNPMFDLVQRARDRGMDRETVDALKERIELQGWKDAVIDALVIGHILDETHDKDPRKALQDLITFETSVALDPRVSEPMASVHALLVKARTQIAWSNGFSQAKLVHEIDELLQKIAK